MTIARVVSNGFERFSDFGRTPLMQAGRSWTRWAGLLVPALILVCSAYRLRDMDYRALIALVPTGIAFWLAFAGYYLAAPLSEWIIFRRLWRLPPRGLAALLRKLVSNEILLGYLGEVYFYAWARRNADTATAPFGAIKDVAILSALAGNAFTLLLLLLSLPVFGSLHLGLGGGTLLASAAVVLVSSITALTLRRQMFSLSRRALWFVTAMHAVRIVTMMSLAAVMWHLLLPGVPAGWLLLLATLRQLLSRLPLIPNKDVVFAGLAASLVGTTLPIVAAVTLVASLILAAHLVVGACLGAAELAGAERS
ncbi:hypothetical protein [Flavisphingomonas formosensis]|uniref:hypothetical protein n=1 Tax=Flavisphingomonas formosensis TaxID=861534 RepID=UPI0012F9483D|nr:hypothetical protein [Sphingomonas formosensis]